MNLNNTVHQQNMQYAKNNLASGNIFNFGEIISNSHLKRLFV